MISSSNNKKLIIIGAGGHGKVVADIAVKMHKWQEIAFLDDDETRIFPLGIKFIGKSGDALAHIGDSDIFVAIGDNKTREDIMLKLEKAGANIPILIHPNAIMGMEVELESGTVVMAGVDINSCTRIGKGCIINTGATVDHDNQIGDYVHISPGVHLAGTVNIGKGVWLGIGSIVSNNLHVADDCMIGVGAVVIKDITESGTYVGNPARRLDQ